MSGDFGKAFSIDADEPAPKPLLGKILCQLVASKDSGHIEAKFVYFNADPVKEEILKETFNGYMFKIESKKELANSNNFIFIFRVETEKIDSKSNATSEAWAPIKEYFIGPKSGSYVPSIALRANNGEATITCGSKFF